MESRAIEDDLPENQTAERRLVELPVKTYQYIIEFLDNEDDAGTTSNCALVCRQWLSFSRSKLYYGVPLTYRRQWMSFKRLVLHPPSSIAVYLPKVRELYIWPCDEAFLDEERQQPRIGWGKGQERPWAHAVLNQCATQLGGLTHVYFKDVDWTRAPDMALLCASNYRSLTTLELWDCTFANVGQLGLLVTAFPTLYYLRLFDIRLRSSKPLQAPYIPKAGRSLSHLVLDCADDFTAAVSPWLAHSQLVRNLMGLEWHNGRADDWATLSEAINGPGLQTLFINRFFDQRADFTRFTSLKALELGMGWMTAKDLRTDEGWNLLHQAISSISSSRLEELDVSCPHFGGTLSLKSDSILAASTMGCLQAIDDTLARPQFSRLRHVKVVYWIPTLIQPVFVTSNTALFPSRDDTVSNPDSSPHADLSNGLVNRQSDSRHHDPYDPQHPFRLYAEPIISARIQEELKLKLGTRGILGLVIEVEQVRRIVELPLEMHYYIIGCLDNKYDAGTIVNCALVCRRWMPFSLFKLYDDIELHYRRQWIAFKRLVLHPPSSIRGYLSRVRGLHILVWDKKYFYKVLNQCAIQLNGLTRMDFRYIDWTRAPDMALLCGSNYCSLTVLNLADCTFKNVGQLRLLVNAFPALDVLGLWDIGLKSSKRLRVSRIPKADHSLTRLDLSSYDDDVMAAISRWLVHSQLIRKLSHLVWAYSSKDDWKTLAEGIDGPSLQELEAVTRRDEQVDLTRFTNLKIFTLHWRGTTDEGWDLYNQTVSSISSTRLEELCIVYWDDRPSSLDSILATFARLKTIDDTLARPRFAQLRHVKLEYGFDILTQAIPITFDTSPFPSRDSMAPSPGSSSQADPSNELVDPESDSLGHDLDDPQHPFRLYVERHMRHRTQEGLKQLVTRGILDLTVEIELSRPSAVVAKTDGDTMDLRTLLQCLHPRSFQ